MTWDMNLRGFLPPHDPLETLAATAPDMQNVGIIAALENLSVMLPQMVEDRCVREEVVHQLRLSRFGEEFVGGANDAYAERAMLLYSYLASAYVYARHELPATRIPKEIAIPLRLFSERVGRPPILSYASYCLTNWRRIDPAKPIELGNIELLQHFCHAASGRSDERWFILVHVDIEAKAAEGLTAIADAATQVMLLTEIDATLLYDVFQRLVHSLTAMNRTLARMPEECSPDNYYKFVRPYIFGFKDLEYEGAYVERKTFRGETGAQSSIVPALLIALGIRHEDSMLTRHLTEMRDYMPPHHRLFLQNLEATMANNTLRDSAMRQPQFRPMYNECVSQLAEFRGKHFEYAVNYIAKKVDNPEGTGGTPYIAWLQQLRDETVGHLIPG